jgi:rhamnosyltransferase
VTPSENVRSIKRGETQAPLGQPAAGIVVFRPDLDLLLPLIEEMVQACDPVLVFLNDPQESLRAALTRTPVRLIESSYNLGVADALNILVLTAAWEGKSRLLLLDQDSSLAPDAVAQLGQTMDALAKRGERPAAVGPKPVPPHSARLAYRAPNLYPQPGRAPAGNATPVRFLITSGTLLDLKAFAKIGRFRSDYFIDAIDTEWCFRAWRRGFSCWVRTDVTMEHRVGSGVMTAGPFGPPIPRQSDMRLYAYVRNQAHGVTLAHIPWAWKLRFSLHIMRITLVAWAHHGFRPRFLGDMVQAVWRGLRGHLGPPPGAEHAATIPGLAKLS